MTRSRTVSFHSPKPRKEGQTHMKTEHEYMKIYKKLRDDIISGAYKAGSRLPSKRTCADRFGVSVITVEHAYELLEDEGYIVPKERSGYFVSSGTSRIFGENRLFQDILSRGGIMSQTARENAPKSLSEAHRGIMSTEADPQNAGIAQESVPGTTGRSDFPFSVYARTVRRILSEDAEGVLVKSPGQGCLQFRRAISRYLARSRNIFASPDQIVIGSGAEHLYGLIIDMIGRYRSYGIEDPSYGKIHQVYRLNGAQMELLPLGPDGISTKDLEKCSAGVLHITPYRSYPSGITAGAAKKREYISFARKRGAWIIEDDFESEFTPSSKPEETLFEIDGGIRVIYVNSFTMTISPGVRTAYMVLPKLLLPVYKERLGFCSCTVPTLDQLVLAQLIDSGDFERHVNRIRRRNRRSAEQKQ